MRCNAARRLSAAAVVGRQGFARYGSRGCGRDAPMRHSNAGSDIRERHQGDIGGGRDREWRYECAEVQKHRNRDMRNPSLRRVLFLCRVLSLHCRVLPHRPVRAACAGHRSLRFAAEARCRGLRCMSAFARRHEKAAPSSIMEPLRMAISIGGMLLRFRNWCVRRLYSGW